LTGKVVISGSIEEKAAVYAHVATLGNDEVTLQTGMDALVFKNSGISVNLAKTVAVDASTNDVSASVYEFGGATLSVNKVSGVDMVIQTGANQGDELRINIDKMDAYTLGVRNSSIQNRLSAANAITQVDKANNLVSTQRAALGALQNRLNHKIANLDTSAENLQAAEGRIRDVDMAKEMTEFTKKNILVQASTAMLAQANAAPQNVLSLLR